MSSHANANMSNTLSDRIGDDLIRGGKPLAQELGLTERQIYHAADKGLLPLFRIGKLVCGRRSTLREHIARLEAGHLKQAS